MLWAGCPFFNISDCCYLLAEQREAVGSGSIIKQFKATKCNFLQKDMRSLGLIPQTVTYWCFQWPLGVWRQPETTWEWNCRGRFYSQHLFLKEILLIRLLWPLVTSLRERKDYLCPLWRTKYAVSFLLCLNQLAHFVFLLWFLSRRLVSLAGRRHAGSVIS